MPIDPGRLRHRVTVQGETLGASNGRGGRALPTVSTIGTVWAAVEPLDERERLQAQQTEQNVSHRVRVRYEAIASPSAVESFLHEGRTLRVVGPPINEDERDEILRFECTEEVG